MAEIGGEHPGAPPALNAKEVDDYLRRTESLPDQALMNISDMSFNSEHISKITDLNRDEINALVSFDFFISIYKRYCLGVDAIRYDFLKQNFLEYRLSLSRKSRDEMVKMLSALATRAQEAAGDEL